VTMASAIPTLTISDGSTLVTVVDGGAGDSAAMAGVVQYTGSVGSWNVVVSSDVTKPAMGSAADPQMQLLIQAGTQVGGNLYIAYSDTDYTGTGGILANIVGHVVDGGPETAGMLVAGNTANVAGTINAAGSPLNFGSILIDVPVQSLPILASEGGQLPGSAPYSLTDFVIINSPGASADSITANFGPIVPDGGRTVTLLGAALASLGVLGCFMKRGSGYPE